MFTTLRAIEEMILYIIDYTYSNSKKFKCNC